MKKIILLMTLLIVLSAAASAQVLIPSNEQTTCGDGIREGHEMCEPDTDENLCEQAGEILGIYMACDPRDCTCLPDRMDCGNEIREGAEYCDPGEKEDQEENDFCDELGTVFNETFTCDPGSCLCKPETAFNENVCGDDIVSENEDCEKDEDCRTDQVCLNCACVIKERDVEGLIEQSQNETVVPVPIAAEIDGDFDYHNLVGVELPDLLKRDFEDEKTNVHVYITDEEKSIIGVITSHGVVQEIVDDGLDDPTFNAYVKNAKAQDIIDSEDRTLALVKAVEEGDIIYKPAGFFKKIIFWFKGLFR